MSRSTQEPSSLGPAVEAVMRGRSGLFTGRTIASVVGVILLVLLMVVPSFWAFHGIKASADTRTHTFDVINRADALLSSLKDAETSQRGYLMTGHPTFLEPYLAVRDGIDGQLAELRQRTRFGPAQRHLDAIAPLVAAKMAEMSRAIDLRRSQRTAEALAVVREGEGKRLMDAIRGEMDAFIQVERGMLAGIETDYQVRMGRLFAIIVAVSLLTLLIALSFINLIHRQTHERMRDRVHLETSHLLEIQEESNKRLLQINLTLQESEENLAVTLNSIGDAVIATDAQARVTRMNPIAEKLTGWSLAEAIGRPVDDCVHAINQETRKPTPVPVRKTLEDGTVQGLANHTILIARGGGEADIADSCAPIRDRNQQVIGAVLVFRDVTKEYASARTLHDSSARIHTILNTAVDGIITFHARDGSIETVNPAAEWMFGYTSEELIGQSISKLIPELDQGEGDTSLDQFQVSDKARAMGLEREVLGHRKDGCFFPLEIVVSEMQLGGERFFTGVLRDITARKEAGAALLKAGALQSAIFNSANFSSIATDAKGVIQIFNVGAERMLGYEAAEVMNKVTPADISDASEVIARAKTLSLELGTNITPGFEALVFKASRGIEDIYELTYIRKDGSRFPAVVSVTALRDAENAIIGYLLIGTDNTARKQAEEALLKAGALQSAIFNSANFSSIATDAKGVIQIFNVGAERMLGYTAAEVMNKVTPADISDAGEVIARAQALSLELGSDIAPGFEALVFKASRGIEDIYELTYIRKDGSRFPAVVSVTALRDAENAIIGYLLIGTDNSARKQVEAERARLDEALEVKHAEWLNAKVVAEKANLAKSEFLSSMSHELRSPLNAILGFAQLMDSEIPVPTLAQKASLDQILHAGWYLLDLVNEILDLAVIESGKLSFSPEPVALAEVLFDCNSMIEPQAQRRGIKLNFSGSDIPVFVHADRVRLKQVLINLLSNAIKYNILGGTVTVTCSMVTPGRTRISVRDTGHGLAPDKLRQLFQPFNRLGQEHSAEDGTGIGLVMSKLLVELMGGTIGVESSVGVGSLFWFELNSTSPRELGDNQAAPKSLEPFTLQEGARQQTVLYVEDNPANLSLVEQLVARRPDLHLLSAGNATLGIEIARAQRPDVILMDINLPGLNGFQALEILKEDSEMLGIPVIALSANAMVGDVTKGLEAGFFRYITKPINIVEFMQALDIALESPGANEGRHGQN
jgi:PAS domain S-box-containing protein